jgi:hypothetical protein
MQAMELEKSFKNITNAMMKTYQQKMEEFFKENKEHLTNADVAIMIINLSIGLSVNIYYTLKQMLPSENLDFDYMKATICNSVIEGLENIKNYTPNDSMINLTEEEVKEALHKGSVNISLSDGTLHTVNIDEIMVTKKDAAKIKKDFINADNTPQIIKPRGKLLRGKYN